MTIYFTEYNDKKGSVKPSLMEKNYSKLFGESLFKTIKNYSHYSPMLNWRNY